MAEEGFETREEIIAAFDGARAQAGKLEEATFAAGALPLLLKIERSVQRLGLFSPNEEFDELDIELQPLVTLPYLIALAEGAAREGRLEALGRCERYLRTFLGLCSHYGLLSPLAERLRLAAQAPGFQPAREDKIALYREEKATQEESGKRAATGTPAAAARGRIAEEGVRALSKLLMVPQERQMLEYGARLASDPAAKEEYERYRAQPLPKPTVFRMDKPADAAEAPPEPPALVVESFEQKVSNERHQKLAALRGDGRINAKMQVLTQLNQPSHPQPTMTLDQFDQLEYDLLQNKEAETRRAKAQKEARLRELGIEDSEDSENELVADMKTYKARDWDNFKDENEKGGGNRYGK